MSDMYRVDKIFLPRATMQPYDSPHFVQYNRLYPIVLSRFRCNKTCSEIHETLRQAPAALLMSLFLHLYYFDPHQKEKKREKKSRLT